MSYSYLQNTFDNDVQMTYPPTLAVGLVPTHDVLGSTPKLESGDSYGPEWRQLGHNNTHLPYNRGSRTMALAGLIATFAISFIFIALGVIIYIIAPSHVNTQAENDMGRFWGGNSGTERTIDLQLGYSANRIISLALTTLVTICGEATGHVHGTTLKWALARQGRLPFNANLRLFSTAGGVFSSQGLLVNVLFSISLITAYAASSSILLKYSLTNPLSLDLLPDGTFPTIELSIISFIPPLLLGGSFFVQASLGLIAFLNTDVLTWSTNPMDVTAALLSEGFVQHRPSRCMRSVIDSQNPSTDPIKPSRVQPSPRASHHLVRRIVWMVWLIPVATIASASTVVAVSGGEDVVLRWEGGARPLDVLWGSVLQGAIQSVLTLGLHCCELVTTLARDESVWKRASAPRGLALQPRFFSNPIAMLLGSFKYSLPLLLFKPLIHWLFGIGVSMEVGEGMDFFGLGIFLLSGGLIMLAVFMTVVATSTTRSSQPATFGHIQTLVDLADEWPGQVDHMTRMWWGHKWENSDGVVHAGTSGEKLEEVKMHLDYADRGT